MILLNFEEIKLSTLFKTEIFDPKTLRISTPFTLTDGTVIDVYLVEDKKNKDYYRLSDLGEFLGWIYINTPDVIPGEKLNSIALERRISLLEEVANKQGFNFSQGTINILIKKEILIEGILSFAQTIILINGTFLCG